MLISRPMHRCFFFSSRRRHTRCGRDWSSDVCSSDLLSGLVCYITVSGFLNGAGFEKMRSDLRRDCDRSEERRVGKECRSRRSPDPQKKKDEKHEHEVAVCKGGNNTTKTR